MNAAVREAVLARAGDLCEACQQPHGGRAELDHFLGGRGRRTQMESAATCWLLGLDCGCAWWRTENSPSAAYWNERFAAHAQRHGLPVLAHVEHLPVVRR